MKIMKNGVFVELNEDKNELTYNMNSDFRDNFMVISMIKIADGIISDENKDEAKKYKNEKYKITEWPMDDTNEENTNICIGHSWSLW